MLRTAGHFVHRDRGVRRAAAPVVEAAREADEVVLADKANRCRTSRCSGRGPSYGRCLAQQGCLGSLGGVKLPQLGVTKVIVSTASQPAFAAQVLLAASSGRVGDELIPVEVVLVWAQRSGVENADQKPLFTALMLSSHPKAAGAPVEPREHGAVVETALRVGCKALRRSGGGGIRAAGLAEPERGGSEDQRRNDDGECLQLSQSEFLSLVFFNFICRSRPSSSQQSRMKAGPRLCRSDAGDAELVPRGWREGSGRLAQGSRSSARRNGIR